MRGAGTSKFVGLVAREELDFGVIEHALDFAFKNTSGDFVYPATKSDGDRDIGGKEEIVPQGSRFTLDPSLDITSIEGLDRTGKIMALALQRYGMFVVDTGGSNKFFVEAEETAKYGEPGVDGQISEMTRDSVAAIPTASFRRVTDATPTEALINCP